MGGRLKGRVRNPPVVPEPLPEEAAAWLARLRSPQGRRALRAVVRDEIDAAGNQRLRDLVDERQVRAALAAWDPASLDAGAVAGAAVGVAERMEKRMRRQRRSLEDVAGAKVMDGVHALIDAELPNPEALEEILAQTLRQEFVRKLFAELIHSAILAFNKRVNPIFSGLTASILDDQIRSFIALGMPMLQEQAVAFALSRANQDFVVDLARGLIRAILAAPIADLVPATPAAQRHRVARLVENILASEQLRERAPALALEMWADVFAQVRDRRLGEFVDTASLAGALAEPIAELALALLGRPRVARLLSGAASPP